MVGSVLHGRTVGFGGKSCLYKYIAKPAVEGDMGWEPCLIKKRIEMLRLWNHHNHSSAREQVN